MKSALLVIAIFLTVLTGCDSKAAREQRERQAARQALHGQFLAVVTNLKVHLQNQPTASTIKELTVNLESFFEINHVSLTNDATAYELLDLRLQVLNYLLNKKSTLDPAHNLNDLAAMLAARPEVADRIKAEMNAPFFKLEQNAAFHAYIYCPAAELLVLQQCELILKNQ